MPAIALTPAQRKEQRSLAHHLDPVVAIGQDGLTPAVLREADTALGVHGLIKVRVFADDRAAREGPLAELASRLSAAPVQHIGKLLVLWRPALPPKSAHRARGAQARAAHRQAHHLPRSPSHRPTVKKVRVLGNQRVTTGGSIKRAKTRQTSQKKALG
ncbi:MAG: YhbY family RNA-binding protein [Burkholderiaceae bacterium]